MRNYEVEISQWKQRLQSPEGLWDSQVFSAARRGEPAAINRLISRYEGRIAKLIDSRLKHVRIRDKQDVFQEALVQVFNGIHNGELTSSSEAAFVRWLVLKVTTVLAEYLEDEAHRDREVTFIDLRQIPQLSDDYRTQDDSFRRSEQMVAIRLAVQELPKLDRELLELHLEGQRAWASDFAQVHGLSLAEVRRRVQRVLAKLRRSLPADL